MGKALKWTWTGREPGSLRPMSGAMCSSTVWSEFAQVLADVEQATTPAKAGARHGGYVLLRLPLELREMFEAWLHTHFPDRAERVMA